MALLDIFVYYGMVGLFIVSFLSSIIPIPTEAVVFRTAWCRRKFWNNIYNIDIRLNTWSVLRLFHWKTWTYKTYPIP